MKFQQRSDRDRRETIGHYTLDNQPITGTGVASFSSFRSIAELIEKESREKYGRNKKIRGFTIGETGLEIWWAD